MFTLISRRKRMREILMSVTITIARRAARKINIAALINRINNCEGVMYARFVC